MSAPAGRQGSASIVEHAILTLTGTVQWPAERAAAEDAVRRIPGVQRIVNDVTVGHIASEERFEPPEVA